MLYHHLFGMYAVVEATKEKALQDSTFLLFHNGAIYGKICVGIFVFITGYGFYASIDKNNENCFYSGAKKLQKFYPFFLFMCILYYVLACIFPYGYYMQPNRLPYILLNMVGLCHGIPDYWYIMIVLGSALGLYPSLVWALKKNTTIHHFLVIALLSTSGIIYFLDTFQAIADPVYFSLIRKIAHVVSFIPFFLLGWTYNQYISTPNTTLLSMVSLCFTVCVLCYPIGMIIFIATILLTKLLSINHSLISKTLSFLGSYSACMWLNHRLIFGYWFQDYFYTLSTPLNLIILIILSLLLSFIITHLWFKLRSLLKKWLSKTKQIPANDK